MPRSLQVTTHLRNLTLLLLCAFLGVGQAGAGSMTLLGVGGPAAGGGASLTLDGSTSGSWASGTTATVTLSTTKTNDIIILSILVNGTNVSSISDTAGLTWAARPVGNIGGGLAQWWAKSTGILTNDLITITYVGTPAFSSLIAFGVNGANFTSPFDPNGALPATAASGTVSLTTTNANTMLIAAYRFSGTGSPTAGAGWTTIVGANFQLAEYKVVSATQSGTVATVTTGAADENGGIGDAITQ